MKMTKEQFLEQIFTRREAEHFLQISQVAFQHHIRQGNIKPCKEYGRGNAKVQLFWLEDLEKLKKTLK